MFDRDDWEAVAQFVVYGVIFAVAVVWIAVVAGLAVRLFQYAGG